MILCQLREGIFQNILILQYYYGRKSVEFIKNLKVFLQVSIACYFDLNFLFRKEFGYLQIKRVCFMTCNSSNFKVRFRLIA
jgi:hypothetical protein